jgi:hypothetical protein
LKEIEKFYLKLGEEAKSKGVVVSIISIANQQCNLDSLSKLTDLTGGEVELMDPSLML